MFYGANTEKEFTTHSILQKKSHFYFEKAPALISTI